MKNMSPKEIIEILNELYEDGRHKTIVDSIEELPKSEWNYDIKIHLARAYNNTSEYDKALNILMSEDTKNEKDAYWNYVVGYAYFHKWNYISALNQLFGFDLDKYSDQMKEIFTLDSLASASLTASDKGYGSASRALDGYYKYKEQSRDKANELFKSFPDDFTRKIKLYTGYSNAFDFETIYIEEGKSANQITDFGITCI